jgi:hypothetical protein
MRVKTTSRNTSNEIQLAQNLKKDKVNKIQEQLQKLLHYEKDIQRALLESTRIPESVSTVSY